MKNIDFPKGSVPVRIAAEVYGRDPSWVRAGIIAGIKASGLRKAVKKDAT